MSVTVWYFADAAWVSGVFGLVGVLAGGLIAGFAARRAWVRDSRRKFYDRFLTAGQKLLAAMEKAEATSPVPDKLRVAVDEAYSAYMQAYATVQTVAKPGVVTAARTHTYRLQALKNILDGDDAGRVNGHRAYEREDFPEIAESVRKARHDAIDAMRVDLGVRGSVKPPEGQKYDEAIAEAVAEAVAPSTTGLPR